MHSCETAEGLCTAHKAFSVVFFFSFFVLLSRPNCVVTMVSRNVAGKSSARPPLKRFVSSAAWVDTEEPSVAMKG